jgi:lipoprotein-releasing system ATP-binding protein
MSDPSSTAIVLARGLGKEYAHARGPVTVLTDLDLSVVQGEVVSIVGKSGSGKSTLLHILGTLDQPTSGTIELLGRDPSSMADLSISQFRNRHIGFVFQFHHLLPEFSALENCCLPVLIQGGRMKDARLRAEELLTQVGLQDRLHHKPSELSGGEQQRVAIARSLVMKPDLVLADEPTGNLDPKTAEGVRDLFLEVSRSRGATVIIATHNRDLADRCDRKLTLHHGRLTADATNRNRHSGGSA